MDVRCENCHTEYELDVDRLKPGGITVKCTACGHLFKVLRRSPTLTGGERSARPSQSGAAGATGSGEERLWLVRLQDGEVRRCRELATLQQWIVSGEVSRDAEISHTGEKWKRLGDIVELDELFAFADQGRRRRGSSQRGGAEGAGRAGPSSEPARLGQAQGDQGPGDDDEPRPVKEEDIEGQETLEWSGRGDQALPGTAPPPDQGAARPRAGTASGVPHPRVVPSRNSGKHRAQPRASSVPPPAPREPSRLGRGRSHPPPSAADSAHSGREAAHRERAASTSHPPSGGSADPAEGSESSPPPANAAGGERPAEAPLSPSQTALGLGATSKAPGVRRAPPPPSGEAAAAAAPSALAGSGAQDDHAAAPEPTGSAAPRGRDAPDTGQWASSPGRRRFHLEDEGPSGPTGGLARGVPTHDVAFAATARRTPAAPEPEPADQPELEGGGPPPRGRRSGGAAYWVLGTSLAVMGAAAAVVYLLVLSGEPSTAGGTPDAAGPALADAETLAAEGQDAGAAAEIDPALLREASYAVFSGNRDEMKDVAEALDGAVGDFDVLIARSRLAAARAQLALDLRGFAAGTEARELASDAREYADEARDLAASARDLKRGDVAAYAATGEARRLVGQRARDVRRPLRRAISGDPDHVDARLSLALLLAEEGRDRQARDSLEELARAAEDLDPPDPRPRLQLALFELEREEDEAAAEHAEAVLALAPDHEVAEHVLEVAEERADVVAQDDPMPDEVGGSSDRAPTSYADYVNEADAAAGAGRCDDALEYYRRAIELDSEGLDALVGLAQCHLDRREFASAHSRFEEALALSSEHEDALYGVAEAYQQQGLSDRAARAYERFLSAHPESGRAQRAEQRIERIRGAASEVDEDEEEPESRPDEAADDDGEGEDGEADETSEDGQADESDDDDDDPKPFLSDE